MRTDTEKNKKKENWAGSEPSVETPLTVVDILIPRDSMQWTKCDVSFEIPDAWWFSAGMATFTPMGRAFDAVKKSDQIIIEVPIAVIRPLSRDSGIHGLSEYGFAEERMVDIFSSVLQQDAFAAC